jgi:AcrR family transcriptional regulator
MEAIAQEAGVGKATLFRRFGDRNGLLLLLMDDAEARFRQSCTAGPPPLGPGAPARGSRKHASTRPASTVARTPREDRSICASSHVLGFRDGIAESMVWPESGGR